MGEEHASTSRRLLTDRLQAYWPGESSKPRRQAPTSHMPISQMPEDDEDELPLLPKSRRRLLKSAVSTQDKENEEEMAISQRKRRGGGRLASPSESMDGSVASRGVTPLIARSTARRTRAGSTMSDVSTGTTGTATGTGTGSGTGTGTTRRSAATKSLNSAKTATQSRGKSSTAGGRKKEPIVIEESDEGDDDDPMDAASASAALKVVPPSGTIGRSSGRAANKAHSSVLALEDGANEDGEEEPVLFPPRRRKLGLVTSTGTDQNGSGNSSRVSATPNPTSSTATGRRRLVAEDVDEEIPVSS